MDREETQSLNCVTSFMTLTSEGLGSGEGKPRAEWVLQKMGKIIE